MVPNLILLKGKIEQFNGWDFIAHLDKTTDQNC